MGFAYRTTRKGRALQRPWPTLLPWYVTLGAATSAACYVLLISGGHLPGYPNDPRYSVLFAWRLAYLVDYQVHQIYLLPIAAVTLFMLGVYGAYKGWLAGRKRRELVDSARSIEDLKSVSWEEFELLVGEAFRRKGYKVTETGQGGADGGVDLILERGSTKALVQCKQWQKMTVGVAVVREMLGLMVHHGANRAVIVCVGRFTKDAFAFAHGKPIDLIGAERLVKLVEDVRR